MRNSQLNVPNHDLGASPRAAQSGLGTFSHKIALLATALALSGGFTKKVSADESPTSPQGQAAPANHTGPTISAYVEPEVTGYPIPDLFVCPDAYERGQAYLDRYANTQIVVDELLNLLKKGNVTSKGAAIAGIKIYGKIWIKDKLAESVESQLIKDGRPVPLDQNALWLHCRIQKVNEILLTRRLLPKEKELLENEQKILAEQFQRRQVVVRRYQEQQVEKRKTGRTPQSAEQKFDVNQEVLAAKNQQLMMADLIKSNLEIQRYETKKKIAEQLPGTDPKSVPTPNLDQEIRDANASFQSLSKQVLSDQLLELQERMSKLEEDSAALQEMAAASNIKSDVILMALRPELAAYLDNPIELKQKALELLEKEKDFKERVQSIQEFAAWGNALSQVLSLIDPQVGAAVSQVLNLGVTIASAVAIPSPLSVPTVIGAVANFIGFLFNGGRDLDAERHKAVMEGLDAINKNVIALGKALEALHKDMLRNFQAVHDHLNSIDNRLEAIATQLDSITAIQLRADYKLDEIKTEVVKTRQEVDEVKRYQNITQGANARSSRQEVNLQAIQTVKEAKRRAGQPINGPDASRDAAVLVEHAFVKSANPWNSGASISLSEGDDFLIEQLFKDYPAGYNLGLIQSVLLHMARNQADIATSLRLADGQLARSEVEFVNAASALLDPTNGYLQYLTKDQIGKLLAAGEELEKLHLSLGSTTAIGLAINNYKAALEEFDKNWQDALRNSATLLPVLLPGELADATDLSDIRFQGHAHNLQAYLDRRKTGVSGEASVIWSRDVSPIPSLAQLFELAAENKGFDYSLEPGIAEWPLSLKIDRNIFRFNDAGARLLAFRETEVTHQKLKLDHDFKESLVLGGAMSIAMGTSPWGQKSEAVRVERVGEGVVSLEYHDHTTPYNDLRRPNFVFAINNLHRFPVQPDQPAAGPAFMLPAMLKDLGGAPSRFFGCLIVQSPEPISKASGYMKRIYMRGRHGMQEVNPLNPEQQITPNEKWKEELENRWSSLQPQVEQAIFALQDWILKKFPDKQVEKIHYSQGMLQLSPTENRPTFSVSVWFKDQQSPYRLPALPFFNPEDPEMLPFFGPKFPSVGDVPPPAVAPAQAATVTPLEQKEIPELYNRLAAGPIQQFRFTLHWNDYADLGSKLFETHEQFFKNRQARRTIYLHQLLGENSVPLNRSLRRLQSARLILKQLMTQVVTGKSAEELRIAAAVLPDYGFVRQFVSSSASAGINPHIVGEFLDSKIKEGIDLAVRALESWEKIPADQRNSELGSKEFRQVMSKLRTM